MRARMRGLIGADGYEGVLLLAPCSSIHTYGMRFVIDVAFVDELGIVLEAYRDVDPGKVLHHPGAACVLERMSSVHRPWFEKGDELWLGANRKPGL